MGIEIGECKEVAKLLGMKVFMSEILAYQELGVSINNGLSVSIDPLHRKYQGNPPSNCP